jgi:hypothetical protein
MSVSYFDAISELNAQCEDRESEFCLEQIAETLAVLQTAIAFLESKEDAYAEGLAADLVTCDRYRRLHTSAKRLLDLAQGRELKLFPF